MTGWCGVAGWRDVVELADRLRRRSLQMQEEPRSTGRNGCATKAKKSEDPRFEDCADMGRSSAAPLRRRPRATREFGALGVQPRGNPRGRSQDRPLQRIAKSEQDMASLRGSDRREWAFLGWGIRRLLEGGDTTARVRVESNLEKASSSPLAEERFHVHFLTSVTSLW
jgi:hypothetical protein